MPQSSKTSTTCPSIHLEDILFGKTSTGRKKENTRKLRKKKSGGWARHSLANAISMEITQATQTLLRSANDTQAALHFMPACSF